MPAASAAADTARVIWSWPAARSRIAAARRRSSSSVIRSYSWVPNSLVSTARRSSSPHRRNFANSPCGSSMTWVNWSRLSPTISLISSPASALFDDRLSHRSPARRCRWTEDACRVKPSPRFFLRSCSGTRVTW